jgi:hypothetical protein
MRILTRRIYRAFPELDRYSDERCERFIKAAKRGKWRLLLHGGLIVLVFFAAQLVAMLPFLLIYNLVERDTVRDTPWRAGLLVLAAIPFMAVGPTAAFLTRDWLLRRRVRYVLRTRGMCHGCHYSLIGLPVGAHNFVTCPECGMQSEVDSSLGELVVDDAGQARYVPSAKSLPRPPRIFTPARKRLLLRTAIVAGILLAIGFLASWGGYRMWLRKQANLAASERPGVGSLNAFVETLQPPGGGPSPDGAPQSNAWESFIRAQRILENSNSRVMGGRFKPGAGVPVSVPDFSLIFAPRETTDPNQQMEDLSAKNAALACLTAYAQDGVFDELKDVAARPRAVRNMDVGPGQPMMTVVLPELGPLRNMARICAARMKLAQDAHDLNEFTDAAESLFALARMERQQPFLIDALVGNAVESLAYSRARAFLATHPDTQWLDALDKAIARQSFVPDRAAMFEGERLSILDTTAWVFSDPETFSRGRTSPGLVRLFNNNIEGRLGTYKENRDAINARFAGAAKLAGKDRWERPAIVDTPNGDLLLINGLMPAFGSAFRSTDQIELERRGYIVMSALEHYRLAHGEYPASLNALVPDMLKQAPLDPWSGKPLGYVKLKAKDAKGREYLLYSFGVDGQDNGGNEAPGTSRYNALSGDPATNKGLDFVINEGAP